MPFLPLFFFVFFLVLCLCWNEWKTLTCITSRVLKRVSLLRPSSWQPRLLFQKLSVCLWRSNTWTRPGLFWSSCLPQPTAVYFGDREGPWATLSSRCYCLPRWARTPYLTPPPSARLFFSSLSLSHSLSGSLDLFLSFYLASFCLCSTGTCGPTEALGYTKKPKLAFICSLLPAVWIVHLCSLSAQKMYRFYPWQCYYCWLWVIALPAELLSSFRAQCRFIISY